MGRNSKFADLSCKKHPSHKESQGVCPSCLREKLNRISASKSSISTVHYLNYSSTCSTLSPSSSYMSYDNSPMNGKMAKTKSFSCVIIESKKKPLMKKSRSLAFVVEEKIAKKKKKKNGRFWSILLGKKKEDCAGDDRVLHCSKISKDKSSSKWLLF